MSSPNVRRSRPSAAQVLQLPVVNESRSRPSNSESRVWPVRPVGRFGAVACRPLRGKRALPDQLSAKQAVSSNAAGSSNEPASSTTLEWSQPRPFHGALKQQPQEANSPALVEGITSDVLVAPLLGSVFDAPKLGPSSGLALAGSTSSTTRPVLEAVRPLSSEEGIEYQKVCQHEEQLEEKLLTCVL